MFKNAKVLIGAWAVVIIGLGVVVMWANGEYDAQLERDKRNQELAEAAEERRVAELTQKVDDIVEDLDSQETSEPLAGDVDTTPSNDVANQVEAAIINDDTDENPTPSEGDATTTDDRSGDMNEAFKEDNVTSAPTDIIVEDDKPVPTPEVVQQPVVEDKPEIFINRDFEKPADAWKAYAKPFTHNPDLKPIAILMTDMGLRSIETSQTIETLPEAVSYGFHPEGYYVASEATKARMNGNEIYMMLPMEPSGSLDPGKYGMLVDAPEGQNLRRLDEAKTRFEGYVGFVSHMGSRFTGDVDGMTDVMGEIRNDGLAFIDSMSTAQSVSDDVAAAMGLAYLKNNRFVDNARDIPAIISHLQALEDRADKGAPAIGIARVSDLSVQVLLIWMVDLEARGYQLVPVSHFLDK